MEWLNLHTSTLDSPEFIGADPVQRATWLCLLRYCAGQENGGTIPDCEGWQDRRWQQLCRITKREIGAVCDLWKWNGKNLVVWCYPVEKENEVKRNRTNGARGGRPPGSKAPNPEETTRLISAETERKGKERKGIGREGNSAPVSGEAPPSGSASTGKPADLAEVLTYFAELRAPEAEGVKFFDHYEANGWKQGGRAALKSWRAAARSWVTRWREGGGGAAGGAKILPDGPVAPAGAGGLCLPDEEPVAGGGA